MKCVATSFCFYRLCSQKSKPSDFSNGRLWQIYQTKAFFLLKGSDLWGVVAKCKICVQFCVQFPDLTYVDISDLMHTICTIAFSRWFLCFFDFFQHFVWFSLLSCRYSCWILLDPPCPLQPKVFLTANRNVSNCK